VSGMEEGDSLFALGTFKLPSGHTTHFKIECDILVPSDWKALARLAVELLPPFGAVEGVPRGGIAFAEALEDYVTAGASHLLIADDVWVSGKSMEAHRAGRDALGVVAFSRSITMPPWCKPLLYLHPAAEAVTYQLNRPYGVLEVGN
jgi:hypothetical protein